MTTLRFDKYQREARVDPLEIDLPDGGVVKIAVPNGQQFMDAEEAGSTRRALKIVCGDSWAELEPLVNSIEDPEALREFVQDVMGAFRMSGGDAPGGWAALIEMIERYGTQIEADLFEIGGWDILDFFRGARPFSQLSRLVDTLPSWSHTGRAMADDDELQRYRENHIASHGKPRPPRMTEWSDFDELIATITDVGNLIRTTIAQANAPRGKRYTFKPHRRPKSAAQRSEARRERETVAEIVALVKPRD